MATPSLLELPNELVLEVIDHLPYLPRDRRTHLLALTTVCKRLHEISTALLLTTPYVNMSRTRRLVDKYMSRPDLAIKVRSLDLYTEERIPAPVPKPAQQFSKKKRSVIRKNKQLWKSYANLVRSTGVAEDVQKSWKDAIEHEDDKAWVGLLLAALPNLECVLLGGLALDYLENVDRLCTTAILKDPRRTDLGGLAPKSYLHDVFLALGPRLRTLELPHKAFGLCWELEWPLATYTGLKHLITHLDALYKDTVYDALPATLERLSVSCGEIHRATELLSNVTSRKKQLKLPSLKQLDLYVQAHDITSEDIEWHTWYDSDDTGILAKSWKQLLDAASQGDELSVVVRYAIMCCYFNHLVALLAKMGASRWYFSYPYRDVRMLDLRGAFACLEPEVGRRGLLYNAERLEMQRKEQREKDQRRQERRERGEVSDTDSDDLGFGCFI